MRNMARFRDPILIQAVIAAALSFSHIHDIADAAGQHGWKAWAYPVSVDLLMVMAWKMIRTPDASKRQAWTWFSLSLGASLGANVATAGVLDMSNPPTWLRVLVAGWPVVAFLGGSFMVHAQSKAPAVEELDDDQEEDQEPKPDELVTATEAHALTGVNIRTVRTWVGRGRIEVKGMRGRANLVSLKDVKKRMVGA